eukprot:TRINITY_DN1023_c0_g3_i2.p1 TRINITY_DN1023_c0_g3~~TRINITY_DN1023_c0_g3_i2.p1  ORF type:complete len:529 (-),score=295.28 TRINITY_DN1023_c0_g3_i2:128-1714(-)
MFSLTRFITRSSTRSIQTKLIKPQNYNNNNNNNKLIIKNFSLFVQTPTASSASPNVAKKINNNNIESIESLNIDDNNNNNSIINNNSEYIKKNFNINNNNNNDNNQLTASDLKQLSDDIIIELIEEGSIPLKKLEKILEDPFRSVKIRRSLLSKTIRDEKALEKLPFEHYDYSKIQGANGENVIGYVPIPVGVAGPILLDGKLVSIPMATTEGCLIASTHRGCKAITESGGVTSVLLQDGITRAPALRFDSVVRANQLKQWIENEQNFEILIKTFNGTSRFGKLQSIKTTIAGRNIYLRFKCNSGDAMGMNMVSKGVDRVIETLRNEFPDLELVSLSGNLCTDKKPSAINWLEGRGKSVSCEARIPGHIVESVLKTTVKRIVDVNINKNLIGSALAGSIGGFNAHASNVVTAIFLATGQDAAQNVESSNCITLMEAINGGKDLYISCTMPSIEVGTVGGGTHLEPQGACLNILDVQGSSLHKPGQNSAQLARAICATVMAGELSLMAALAANHLVRSHMEHNRKPCTV